MHPHASHRLIRHGIAAMIVALIGGFALTFEMLQGISLSPLPVFLEYDLPQLGLKAGEYTNADFLNMSSPLYDTCPTSTPTSSGTTARSSATRSATRRRSRSPRATSSTSRRRATRPPSPASPSRGGRRAGPRPRTRPSPS